MEKFTGRLKESYERLSLSQKKNVSTYAHVVTGKKRSGKSERKCAFLGKKKLDTNGVELKVKCSCSGKNYSRFHVECECHAPEHRRRNGKPGRCLPTMRQEFDEDHQLEASMYHLCFNCPVRQTAIA